MKRLRLCSALWIIGSYVNAPLLGRVLKARSIVSRWTSANLFDFTTRGTKLKEKTVIKLILIKVQKLYVKIVNCAIYLFDPR